MGRHALWGLLLVFYINAAAANRHLDQSMPKKIRLPFSADSGVPCLHWKAIGEEIVGSMVADENHNIFIIGGHPTVLVKYSHQGREIFRRKYSEFPSDQLYAFNGKLYIFDREKGRNILYIINTENGQIEGKIAGLTHNHVNSYCFADGKLTLHIGDSGVMTDVQASLQFMLYDLDGRSIGRVTQPCNIPVHLPSNKYSSDLARYLGKYKNGHLFVYRDPDERDYLLHLIANDHTVQASCTIPDDMMGNALYGGIEQFWSLHGNWISILGKRDSHAEITNINIDSCLQYGRALAR